MATNTRPYLVIYNGVARMVEASNPAAAVRHVVGAAVTELRPARGAEVANWAREKKEIEIAGAAPAAAAAPVVAEGPHGTASEAGFDRDDAWDWIADQDGSGVKGVQPLWNDICAADRMTLEDFDRMRQFVPTFVAPIMEFGSVAPAASVDEVRASLEENPMAFVDVIDAIDKYQAKHPRDPDDVGEEGRDNGGVLANQ